MSIVEGLLCGKASTEAQKNWLIKVGKGLFARGVQQRSTALFCKFGTLAWTAGLKVFLFASGSGEYQAAPVQQPSYNYVLYSVSLNSKKVNEAQKGAH